MKIKFRAVYHLKCGIKTVDKFLANANLLNYTIRFITIELFWILIETKPVCRIPHSVFQKLHRF